MKNVPARVETCQKARDAGKRSAVEESCFEKLIRRCYLKTQNAIAIANVGISALSSMEYHTLLFFRSLSSKLPFCFSLDATLVRTRKDGNDGVLPFSRFIVQLRNKTMYSILLGRDNGSGGATLELGDDGMLWWG